MPALLSWFRDYFLGVPRNIIVLFIAVALSDMSSIMAFSTLSSCLKEQSGLDVMSMAILDSLFHFSNLGAKFLFGIVSDYFVNKLNLIIIGYFGILLSRILSAGSQIPIIDMSKVGFILVIAKLLERTFNGLQGSVRDAYISQSVPTKDRVKCLMMKHTVGSTGCIVGSIINVLLLKNYPGNYALVLNVSLGLSFVATCILIIGVKRCKVDPKDTCQEDIAVRKFVVPKDWNIISCVKSMYRVVVGLGIRFWLVALIAFCFYFGQISELMVKNHLESDNVIGPMSEKKYLSPLLLTLIHFVVALFSTPVTICAEKLKHKNIIFLIFVVVIIICDACLMAFRTIGVLLFCGPLMVGTFTIAFGLLQARAINSVAPDMRGTAIGVLQLFCALACSMSVWHKNMIKKMYSDINIFLLNMYYACATLLVVIIVCIVGVALQKNAKKRKEQKIH